MLRDLEILNIDYSASNPDYRRTEVHSTKTLNGFVLIPFEGPMFARNLVVRADGRALTIESDYTFEDDFTELELMTGKKVIGSLRFSSKVLNDYKEIKIVYQKVGEVIISRKFLLDAAEVILNNDKPIDWLTEVFGKPDTYPPGSHIHDVRETDELVGFKDLVLLFKHASGQTQLSGLELWEELKTIEKDAYAKLDANYKTLWDKMFTHIMNVNLPHPMTKADLGLSEHPNYATATTIEDRNAAFYEWDEVANGKYILRSDVISTPDGINEAVDNYDVNTDGFIPEQSLPFSYYGSGSYLPPAIKGSFEGLGTDLGTGACCLEANGTVTAIIRGYDSKVKNLFYYTNDNIYDKGSRFKFTGIKYTHPLIEADNAALLQEYIKTNGNATGFIPLEANHVVSGSSGLILCIGDYEKGKYYIGLGNNTLDSNSHILKRINRENFQDTKEGNMFYPYYSCIMLIGEYVYFIAHASRWPTTTPESAKFGNKGANYRTRIFYRADKADLLDPTTDDITFKKQTMNYWDLNGNYHTNQETVDFVPAIIGTDATTGKTYCKSMWVNFTVPDTNFRSIHLSPYHCQFIFKEDPMDRTIGKLKMLHGIQYYYYGVRNEGINFHAAVPMTINTKTNTITIDDEWFKVDFNIETNKKTAPAEKVYDDYYSPYIGNYVGGHQEIGAAWIDRIGIMSIGSTANGLPYTGRIWFSDNYQTLGTGNQWTSYNKTFRSPIDTVYNTIFLETPFGLGSLPFAMMDCWVYNGGLKSTPMEIFKGYDERLNADMFYRISDDVEYTKKESLRFPYINRDIYAREPNTRVGKVRVSGYDAAARNLPIINYPHKDPNSAQYGLFRFSSKYYNNGFPWAHSTLYDYFNGASTGRSMDTTGGFYLDTLATHTVNEENRTLTLTPNTAGRYWITKEFWYGLLTQMLGDDAKLVTANGLANGGEYLFSVYLAKPAAGKTIPVSVAYLIYHTISTDTTIARTARLKMAIFDWSATTKNSAGFPIPKITSIEDITTQNNTTTTYTQFSMNTNGTWQNPNYNPGRVNETPNIQFSGTDRNNFQCYFSTGMTMTTVGNTTVPAFLYRVTDGVKRTTVINSAMSNNNNINSAYQALYGSDTLQNVVAGGTSGGNVFYTNRGDGSFSLVEAVLVKGNWTLFVNSDLMVMFNGSPKLVKATNYQLNNLGIDGRNKTFYLYVVSGKTEGYYNLSLAERTASPYHMLVATIVTTGEGILSITPTQVFAISGFTISTSRKGGMIPATTGTFPSDGSFKAISTSDLFDESRF